MDTQRLSAILLIAGFAVVMLSTIINAPGLYKTQDIDERLDIIEANRTRWLINQALAGLYGPLTIGGFAALASTLWTTGKGLFAALGTVAIVTGTISGIYFVYLQTIDPRGGYSGAYPIPENLAYVLWLGGMLLFGFAFLQSNLPDWVGYLTAGIAVVYGIVFVITRAGFLTPFLLAIVGLVIAMVLLGQ